MQANRVDSASFGGMKSGPAYLTRCGVFTYKYPNGQEVRELRHPSDVFAKDSLVSLRAVPLVVGHPDTIDGGNWKTHSIGHVGDDVHVDGIHVAASVHVQDANTADSVGSELVELSCGYSCKVVPEQGTYDGIPYDSRQTQIRYNHVGLGPEGWGRAGSSVRVYFDAQDSEPVHYAWGSVTKESETKTMKPDKKDEETPTVSKADFDDVRGKLAATQAELAALQAGVSEGRLRAEARNRLDLLRVCEAQGLDAAKVDSMTNEEIQRAVLAKVRPDLKTDGESAEYIRAAFSFACASTTIQHAIEGTPAPKQDASDAGPIGSRIDAARELSMDKARNAWKMGGK
jgi:uncharacterized protein